MNDEELITAVRESFTEVRSATSVEQIMSRCRAVRARRWIPGLAGALAVLATAAVAVTVLASTDHQPSHRPGVQLAAWTVAKQTDGNISVTIRELRDPTGLQSKLRADGVPASVVFRAHWPPPRNPVGVGPCRDYTAGSAPQVLHKAVTFPGSRGPALGHSVILVIHPSALPKGAGVQISAGQFPMGASLVTASPACTGS